VTGVVCCNEVADRPIFPSFLFAMGNAMSFATR